MNLPIRTRRLILRPLQSTDAGPMFAYRSRPEVWRYQCWKPADEAEIREFIAKQKILAPDTPGTWFSLAIVRRKDGVLIGDLGLHFLEGKPREAEIGATLSPDFQGRGFAVEALEAACRFLFFSLGKERITASVDPRNLPSIRLLERAGMQKEAFFPRRMTIRGELVDDAEYAVRKDEYSRRERNWRKKKEF